MATDYYQLLDVSPEATTEEIKAAYWRLAGPHHVALAAEAVQRRDGPVRGAAGTAADARRELSRLDEAYAVLVDPGARLRYHTTLAGVDLSRLPSVIAEAAEGFDVDVAGADPLAHPTRPACVVCGGVPAAPAILKDVTGMLVSSRVEEVREAFCRQCGTAAYRTAQQRTLLRGWWGVVALLRNWGAIGGNWAMRRRFDELEAPRRPGRWPDGSPRAPLDPGAPLWRRPKLLLGGAVIVALAAAAVIDTFVL